MQRITAAIAFPLLSAAAIIIILAALPACRKSAKKAFVVGYVNPNPENELSAQSFLQSMSKYGYVKGQNISYIRSETKDKARIENDLREMVAKKVDLIFTLTTPAATMAKKITEGTGIPVVFVMYDSVGSGVVKRLVGHGENITGVQLAGSTPKALEWLLAIQPQAKHIFVPVCFDTGAASLSLRDLKQGAAKLGIRLTVGKVATVEELRASLSEMPADVDAIFMIRSWLVGCNFKVVHDQAVKRKIPVVSAGQVHFDNGLILSYGPRDDRVGQQAARLADRILGGTPAANLPVETSEFFLGINLRAARLIGFSIPRDILQQADFIIRERQNHPN
ncbi:conserved exported hypothetical protein [Candidatus Sulfobium mesophilum]|uniref:ABC transporter substrate binding protein n=1 Tax=Candidatus Sulfobium mesophilum TaxID=2016548 RepID=A0A2U3QEG2_9BACT|nr:conserved exported hypothetical protein [Candidatus Sulfobium mesophilum]